MALAATLAGCGQSDAPDDKLSAIEPHRTAKIVSADEALTGAELARLDPAGMNDAEVRSGIGTGPQCAFRYTADGRPVLAARMRANEAPSAAVVKLNGNLVALEPADGATRSPGAFTLGAGRIRIAVTPDRTPEEDRDGRAQRDAEMVFEAGETRRIGYRGYFSCAAEPR